MIDALRDWKDRLLGRGHASITVPMFDGALKSNSLLEDATVFATLDAPEDMATDGRWLFVADGPTVLRYDATATDACATEAHRFDCPVTALACIPGGGLAVALDGRELRIVGGAHDGQNWNAVAGKKMNAVNAISASADGR